MMSFPKYLAMVVKLNKSVSELWRTNHLAIYREWKAQLQSAKQPLDVELPWLTILAKNCMEDYLLKHRKSDVRIFEFGSGGSSLFFLKHASMVVSVEHDETWFGLVKQRMREESLRAWQGMLVGPDPIPTGQTQALSKDNPMDYYSEDSKFSRFQWRTYASSINRFPNDFFDIVLVDGRSRPSCLYHSISKVRKGGLLVLDNAERTYYLSKSVISKDDYQLICSSNGALICTNQFTQTNVYLRH